MQERSLFTEKNLQAEKCLSFIQQRLREFFKQEINLSINFKSHEDKLETLIFQKNMEDKWQRFALKALKHFVYLTNPFYIFEQAHGIFNSEPPTKKVCLLYIDLLNNRIINPVMNTAFKQHLAACIWITLHLEQIKKNVWSDREFSPVLSMPFQYIFRIKDIIRDLIKPVEKLLSLTPNDDEVKSRRDNLQNLLKCFATINIAVNELERIRENIQHYERFKDQMNDLPGEESYISKLITEILEPDKFNIINEGSIGQKVCAEFENAIDLRDSDKFHQKICFILERTQTNNPGRTSLKNKLDDILFDPNRIEEKKFEDMKSEIIATEKIVNKALGAYPWSAKESRFQKALAEFIEKEILSQKQNLNSPGMGQK